MFRRGAPRCNVLFRRGEPAVSAGRASSSLLFHEYSLLIYIIGPFIKYLCKKYAEYLIINKISSVRNLVADILPVKLWSATIFRALKLLWMLFIPVNFSSSIIVPTQLSLTRIQPVKSSSTIILQAKLASIEIRR